jgi:hypothetical protein
MRAPFAGIVAAAAVAVAAVSLAPSARAAAGPACAPGGPPVVLTGTATPADAKTYRDLPFDVQPGTTRVEVGYRWADGLALPAVPVVEDLTHAVFDLGLWDEDGVGTVDGFRGWSGSRQGKTATGQAPVWVQADTAERGYRPDPVEPGTWHVDLGIATVGPTGAAYEVTVRCRAVPVGPAFVSRPVDATHVARDEPGWYLGDLHLHAFHSNARGPAGLEMVEHARAAGLDFVPVTEYVTDQHHRELGPAQEANPDVLIWPGREIITYFGHMIVLGETPHAIDWRHGAPGVRIGDIQRASKADGALFGLAHPTIFPTAALAGFCRGCEFMLSAEVDWKQVDMLEVSTGHTLQDDTRLGGPGLGVRIQNPFIVTAIDLWQRLLLEGHKITAVAGSDERLGPDYGTTATAVYAEQQSRPALQAAIEAGHAYVRTLGTNSPTVEVTAETSDGQRGIVGDTLHADAATVTVRVRGGAGQALAITKNGLPAGIVPITSDDATHTFLATRDRGSGPLGTFWRVDTFDLRSLTTIGNPVFLQDPAAAPPPTTTSLTAVTQEEGRRLPATGARPPLALVLALLAAATATRFVGARARR